MEAITLLAVLAWPGTAFVLPAPGVTARGALAARVGGSSSRVRFSAARRAPQQAPDPLRPSTLFANEIVGLVATLAVSIAITYLVTNQNSPSGDITSLKGDIASLKTDLKGDIASLKTELKGDIASLKTELKGDIASLKTELKGDIASLKTELGAAFFFVLSLPSIKAAAEGILSFLQSFSTKPKGRSKDA